MFTVLYRMMAHDHGPLGFEYQHLTLRCLIRSINIMILLLASMSMAGVNPSILLTGEHSLVERTNS